MHTSATDRRRFLRLAMGFTTGALLSGCGGDGGGAAAVSDAVTVVPAGAGATTGAAAASATDAHPLNLALNLAYVGAAFYGHAARGAGLAPAMTGGIGRAGSVIGARAATFSDPAVAGYAAELADDKQAEVASLRQAIGAGAAAQPAIDLSPSVTGAFSVAAQRAGIVAPGGSFDPYAGDSRFLIAASLIEMLGAAAYRTLLIDGGEGASPLVARNLGDAIYHGGLIHSLLDAQARTDPAIDAARVKLAALTAMLDGTAGPAAGGPGTDILDAEGRPIPFTRDATQVLRVLYLSKGASGGFLPAGANGVAV